MLKSKLIILLAILLLVNLIGYAQTTPNRELVNAIVKGEVIKAKKLIDKENNLNAKDTAGWAYLHYCAYYDKIEITEYLISKGANVDITKDNGSTPLLVALLGEHIKIAQLFIDKGANLNYQRPDGLTALLACANNSFNDFAEMLIKKGVDFNARAYNHTNALNLAVFNGNNYLAKLLLEKGIEYIASDNGYSPLMIASFYGNFNAVRLLVLYKGKDIIQYTSPKYGSAFDQAISQQHTDIAEFLQKPKFSVFDLLDLSINKMVVDSVKQNPKLLKVKNNEGFTLLHKAIYLFNQPVLEDLIKLTKDINIADTLGRTPLFYAVFLNNVNAVKALINQNANVNYADNEGYTPLFIAEQNENKEIVKLLKTQNAQKRELNFKLQFVNPTLHLGFINSVSISNDKKYALTGAEDNNIKLLDVATWREIKTFYGHTGKIYMVNFSDNSKQAISASADGTIKLWDIITGQLIRTYLGHGSDVVAAYISPDNKRIISTSHDEKIIIWDLLTGQILKKISAHDDWIRALAISPDGKFAATGADDKTIKLWSLETYSLISTLTGHVDFITSLCFSPDNKYIFTGDKNGNIFKWNTTTFKKETELIGHKDQINKLCFSPDKSELLSASMDNTIRLWNLETCKEQALLSGVANQNDAVFMPDGNTIFSSMLSSLILWNKNTKQMFQVTDWNSTGGVQSIEFLPKTPEKFAVGYQGGLYLWNINKDQIEKCLLYGEIVNKIKATDKYIYADIPNFDYEKNIENHLIIRFSLKDYNKEIVATLPISTSNYVAFSNSAKHVVYTTGTPEIDMEKMIYKTDNSIEIYDLELNKIKKIIPHKGVGVISYIAISPDNNFIATTSSDSTISIWDFATLKESVFKGKNEIYTSICFLSDKKIIAGDLTGKIEIFDLEKHTSVLLSGHTGAVFSLLLLPDNKTLVSGSADNTVRFWDLNTFNPISVCNGHSNWINALALTKENKYVISGSSDNSMKLWDIRNQKEVATLIALSKQTIVFSDIDIKFRIDTAWVTVLPSGYYFCSKNSLNSVGFKYGMRAFGFEQFDLQYNRPDLVLKTIGYNTSDTSIYRQAYQKRLSKMNIKESTFSQKLHIPEIEITNKDSFDYAIEKQDITLSINANDNESMLKTLNVWVNNVPIYGIKGRNLTNKKISQLQENINLQLSQGINKIEISVTNENGTESHKDNLIIVYKPSKPTKPNVYIVGIGVAKYANTKYNLDYVDNDTHDFVNIYKTKEGTFYDKLFIDTLLNENVSKEKVLSLKTKLQKSRPDDIVIVFYSGHGSMSSDNYFYSYKSDKSNFEKTGISYNDFTNLMDSIPARQKILMLNACHSSEIDTTVNVYEKMRTVFSDLRQSNGSIIISLSALSSFGLVPLNSNLKNSNYGIALKKAFDNEIGICGFKADTDGNHQINIAELQSFIEKEVYKLSNRKQIPTTRQENIEIDFPVWTTF